MINHSQYIPSRASPGSQHPDTMTRMVIDEPNASSSSTAGSLAPGSSTLSSRATSATSASPSPQPKTRSRSSSFRHHAFSAASQVSKLLSILPGVSEVLNGVSEGVHAYKGKASIKQAFVELKEQLEFILSDSDPRQLDSDRGNAHFIECIRNLYISVQSELEAGIERRLEVAGRLEDFKVEFADLLNGAIKAGYLVQPKIVVPDEYDNTIPSLKIVNEANGLDIQEQISLRRYDGTPIDDSCLALHVCTYRAMYNDVPVEVEDYYGGSDTHLIETLTLRVEHYNRRGINPILQKLHGGSVYREANKLHVYLVLSPREGTPWVEHLKAKRSIEQLCQIAEKTAIAFKQLRQNKQMNFDDIHVRSDGTLQLIPHTEGDKFLLEEDVFGPAAIGQDVRNEVGWPFEDLCHLLYESSKQGLVFKAIAKLRKHEGKWDQIAVLRIAKKIGLRPPARTRTFKRYPPRLWSIDPGWIVRWPEPSSMQEEPDFNLVDRLPDTVLEEYELEHLTSFMVTHAWGSRGGDSDGFSYRDDSENWFQQHTEWADWECFPLERWQGVRLITLVYESVRLDMVEWPEWKGVLEDLAQTKGLNKNELGVVSRADVMVSIDRQNAPELGTRPIYFYRRKSGVDTSPQQFWGFFSFNRNPLGPTGIISDPPPSIDVEYVNMCDDWDVLIEQQNEYESFQETGLIYAQEPSDRMDVD